MKKSDIRKLLVKHLVEEEIISDDEDALSSTSVVELKKLELRDKEKANWSWGKWSWKSVSNSTT